MLSKTIKSFLLCLVGNDKPQRRGSVGSLDSGMSISFQSTTASNASRDNAAVVAAAANAAAAKMRFPPPAGQQHQHQHQIMHIPSSHIQGYHIHGPVHTHPGAPIPVHHHQMIPGSVPVTGRITRERKLSRSGDENGRSTEV